jgi:tRNA (guanine37-N1)-methyltransferase
MEIDILTLFPEMIEPMLKTSIIGRAVKNEKIKINLHQMRNWAWNSYGAVDDKPYGGGVGMLIRVDVIDKAITEIKSKVKNLNSKIILTSARGKRLTQEKVRQLAKEKNLIIICGHYEGFDERVSKLVDEEISIGDYVLTGGEIPAMVIADAVARLQSGILGKDESSNDESFASPNYIEYPQYTRPDEYNGMKVPEVLKSGDPKKIKEWHENIQQKY